MSLAQLGERLVSVLPPAFLVLVLLNIGFMGAVLYSINHNTEARNAVLTRIIDACLVERMPR